MMDRCYNPKLENYHAYGGRGITVCERWRESFTNFLADMGKRPEGHSLDRIDVDQGYSPENCRWATAEVQANNRRATIIISYGGKNLSMSQWDREMGLRPGTVNHRVRLLGWNVEDALTTPMLVAKTGKKLYKNQRGMGKGHKEYMRKEKTVEAI
jgi:hypothetical protein